MNNLEMMKIMILLSKIEGAVGYQHLPAMLSDELLEVVSMLHDRILKV